MVGVGSVMAALDKVSCQTDAEVQDSPLSHWWSLRWILGETLLFWVTARASGEC